MSTPSNAAIQQTIENLNHPLYGPIATATVIEWLQVCTLTDEQRRRLEEAMALL